METPQEPETNVDSVLPTDILESSGCVTETVDLPSDFFDEFNKEEFIEGLSIIDTWDDGVSKSDQGNVAPQSTVESDIGQFPPNATDTKVEKKEAYSKLQSSRLDDFIKPGSRRDPNKTNEAIKKDKEEKVKEYLAKSLESTDDLRPPGTELDDYFEDNKPMKKEKTPMLHASPQPLSPAPRPDQPSRDSPKLSLRSRDSPSRGSHRQLRLSPRRSPRRHSPSRRSDFRQQSPQRNYKPHWGWGGSGGNMYRSNRRYSPRRSPRRSPARRSPARRSPARRSPGRRSPARRSPARRSPGRRSPRRTPTRRSSPRRSPRRQRRSRSRSPYKRSNNSRRSRSRSPASMKQPDKFLYPTDVPSSPYDSNPGMSSPYVAPVSYPVPAPSPFPPQVAPNYQYGAPYAGGFNTSNPYEYSPGPPPPGSIPNLMSGSVPPLNSVPIPMASVPQAPNPVPAPVMVPAPNMVSPSLPPVTNQVNAPTPYDALAKLAAEGKISREDYLKLAPNKGVSSGLENNQRVTVLTRCTEAISRLLKLHLPSHLVLHNSLLDSRRDAKYIAPKFCSPLKRQAPVEFEFTRANAAAAHQNKHLVDSIIASLPEVEKIVSRPKKKTPKNTKDAAVQTSKPFCEVCEIRESTKSEDASTSVEAEHFCSSVHTQVVEQELISSKAMFNPSGSAGDGTMSIAHLTPAQLVSQLQARAKTLQKTDPAPNQYRGGSANYDYDYEGKSGQQYQNYKNYRY